ncbi:MAG: hypothetical protein AB1414_16465, partial [bacterium]
MKVLFSKAGLQFNKFLDIQNEENLIINKGSFLSHLVQLAMKEDRRICLNNLSSFKTPALPDLFKNMPGDVPSSKIYITSMEKLPQKVVEKFLGLKKDVPQLIITEVIDHPNPLFGHPKPVFATPDVNLRTIEKNPLIKEREIKDKSSEIKEKSVSAELRVSDRLAITDQELPITANPKVVITKPDVHGVPSPEPRVPSPEPRAPSPNPKVVISKPDVNERVIKGGEVKVEVKGSEIKGQEVTTNQGLPITSYQLPITNC